MMNRRPISHEDDDSNIQSGGQASGEKRNPAARQSWLRLVVLCYVLSLPLLALELSSDIGFGRDMCDRHVVGSLGTIFDYSGEPICQIQGGTVFLIWTICAAIVLPLPVLARILYRRMRQQQTASDETESRRTAPSLVRFGLSTVFYTMLAGVAIYAVFWEVRIILASLAAGYPTGSNCLCAGIDIGNYSGKSNSDGIPVCCTVYNDQALYVLGLYSLMILPAGWLARYFYETLRREFSKFISVK